MAVLQPIVRENMIRDGETLAKNNAQNGFPWRSGQAIWCAFDHGSIAGSALGKMGIIDYFRIPKRAYSTGIGMPTKGLPLRNGRKKEHLPASAWLPTGLIT